MRSGGRGDDEVLGSSPTVAGHRGAPMPDEAPVMRKTRMDRNLAQRASQWSRRGVALLCGYGTCKDPMASHTATSPMTTPSFPGEGS